MVRNGNTIKYGKTAKNSNVNTNQKIIMADEILYSQYPAGSQLRDAEIQQLIADLQLQYQNLSSMVDSFSASHESDNNVFQNILNRQQLFVNLDNDPTEDDIPEGQYAIVKNNASGEIKIWANDLGVLISSAALS
jgi:UDP-3-O-acyl-N-acetylglucosamine deacetylase